MWYDKAGERADLNSLHKRHPRRKLFKTFVKQDDYAQAARDKAGWLGEYLSDVKDAGRPLLRWDTFGKYFIIILHCVQTWGTLMHPGMQRMRLTSPGDVEQRTYQRVLWILEQTYARLPATDPNGRITLIKIPPYDEHSK